MSKKVLITGGTKGIGLAAVERFVKEGYEVYVVARNFENFHIDGVKRIVSDLTKLEDIPKIKEETGDIDILVNNAGMDIRKSYIDYQEEDVQKIVNLNLRAPIELIKLYAPKWIENGVGRVVNVASQAAEIGHTDIWYGITKAGLVNLTKSFASMQLQKRLPRQFTGWQQILRNTLTEKPLISIMELRELKDKGKEELL